MGESIQGGLVDILILFYNKVDQTIDCINSFLPSGQHIYVLNNGSDEQQLKKLSRFYASNPQVHLLDAGKNLGVSGGRNFLIQHTRAPWLLSVDNDITIEPVQSWLHLFQEFTAGHPDTAIIVPQIYNVHEQCNSDQLRVRVENSKVFVDAGSFAVTNCFPGGASFIQRAVFEQYGLFDEGMFVGFEDYEFALRAILSEKGAFAVYHINTIRLIHDHQYQKSSSDKEAVKQRYSEERLTASYNRIVEKFGIEFDHDWQWWTKKQVQEMTEPVWVSKAKSIFGRILGKN
ncbi:glycosyltransferase family 2 protein [Lacibacter sp. H407]|uniref:glycosyltransferase family 2 protein n=1 Tax=Lacibacter sp. H407 TaxID=3133423 RepID=UPI0030BC9417